MSSFTQDLATLLGQVRRPGDFFATGTIDIHPPRLEIAGIGPIALPLLPEQAERIVALAEPARYGRGTETLIDTKVRRTWQIGADRIQISGHAWEQDLAQIVARAAAGLGVTAPVEAEFYKLLVYDTGSFFVRHRDSEKAPGMFATLVVVLPSDYSGGELLISHKGREVRLDLRREEPSESAFAAFYADCRHEVLPIASGHRLALIYNLVRAGEGPLPLPPDYETEQRRATALLRDWERLQESAGSVEAVSDPVPKKLIYPLEHAYTEAELGFAALKGADAAVAGVMVQAARGADCDIYLALVSVQESGWAEYGGYGYRGRHWEESDTDFEVGDVEESSETVFHWQQPDGGQPPLGPLPFESAELSPPDAFEGLEPDELDFHEATGNEGATFDRLYQRAALVLWPRRWRVAVLAQGGRQATVPFLGELAGQWRESGAGQDSPLWQEAHRLAARIRDDWPDSSWDRRRASEAGHAGELLRHLADLGDLEELDAFLSQRTAAGAYAAPDNEHLTSALGRLSSERKAELLTAILACNAPSQPAACADLLARCAAASPDPSALLRPAAVALVASLPGDEPQAPVESYGPRREAPSEAMIADVLTALEAIDPELATRALGHFRSNPATYAFDSVLIPAALRLHQREQARGLDSVRGLREDALAYLRRRIGEPLAPPADWSRPSQVACSCTYCKDLSRFLADPAQPLWLLKAAQGARSHVEASIRSNRCDLDCVTETKGRPYTLRCTKNQASYQRRVEQRARDREHLALLEAGDMES